MRSSRTCTSARPGERPQPNGYEHLAPLFVERGALPEGHPRRRRLRDELVGGYLPVAQHIARRHGHRGENADDLEQVARLGLILAVDRFDPERGVDFLSFAVPTITGEVQRYFRDRANAIRVPRRLRELQSTIYDAAAELGQRQAAPRGRARSRRCCGVDLEVVLEGLAAAGAGHTVSLDAPAGDDEGSGERTQFGAALGRVEPRVRPHRPPRVPRSRCSRRCRSATARSSCCGSSAGSPRPRSASGSGSPRCTSRACCRGPSPGCGAT